MPDLRERECSLRSLARTEKEGECSRCGEREGGIGVGGYGIEERKEERKKSAEKVGIRDEDDGDDIHDDEGGINAASGVGKSLEGEDRPLKMHSGPTEIAGENLLGGIFGRIQP